METSEQLRLNLSEDTESKPERSPLSARESRASRTALQEKVWAILTSVTSNKSICELSENLNRDGRSLKIRQVYSQGKISDTSIEYWTTFPRWGILSHGECGELLTSEPRMKGKESSLWRTPMASDGGVCETYERVSDKRLDESLNKTSFGTSSVYGNIPDTVGERRNTNKIQRGFLEKSRDEKNERRVQESRVQFGRVCCGISVPCGKRETEWRERKLSEIGETERKRGNKRNGISVHDGRKWWEIEPDVGRVAYGVPARMERLRCLGNAVVPYQAYPIFEVIAELEKKGDNYE